MEKIYQYGLWLLSKRSYSKQTLSQKIQRKLIQKLAVWDLHQDDVLTITNKTIEVLESKGYLNDQKHKQVILLRYSSKWGQQKIKMKLKQEGISLSHEEWNQFQKEQNITEEKSVLHKQLEKAYLKYSKKVGQSEFTIKSKVIQNLMRQGHNYDEIKAALGHRVKDQNNDPFPT